MTEVWTLMSQNTFVLKVHPCCGSPSPRSEHYLDLGFLDRRKPQILYVGFIDRFLSHLFENMEA